MGQKVGEPRRGLRRGSRSPVSAAMGPPGRGNLAPRRREAPCYRAATSTEPHRSVLTGSPPSGVPCSAGPNPPGPSGRPDPSEPSRAPPWSPRCASQLFYSPAHAAQDHFSALPCAIFPGCESPIPCAGASHPRSDRLSMSAEAPHCRRGVHTSHPCRIRATRRPGAGLCRPASGPAVAPLCSE
jgi:hypothetical protein